MLMSSGLHVNGPVAAQRTGSVAFSLVGGVPMFLAGPNVMNDCGILYVENCAKNRPMPARQRLHFDRSDRLHCHSWNCIWSLADRAGLERLVDQICQGDSPRHANHGG